MADKVTTELANAARRLMSAIPLALADDCAQARLSLLRAIDAFDAKEIERLEFPPRLTEEKLLTLLAEENDRQGCNAIADGIRAGRLSQRAELAALNRVAGYANHLSDTLVALTREVDLLAWLRAAASASPDGYNDPKVRRAAEIISAAMSEAKARGAKLKGERE